MVWTVLVAGGHGSGKGDIARRIQTEVEKLCQEHHYSLTCSLLDLADYTETAETYSQTGESAPPWAPEHTNFDRVLKHIDGEDKIATDKDKDKDNVKDKDNNGNDFGRVVIVHGNYALIDQRLQDRSIMRVFIDVDADTRLSRLVLAGVDSNSDRSTQITQLRQVLDKYLNQQRAEMDKYILPSRQSADVILSNIGNKSDRGVQVIATGVYDRIRQDSLVEHGNYVTTEVRHKRYSFRQEAIELERRRFYEVD